MYKYIKIHNYTIIVIRSDIGPAREATDVSDERHQVPVKKKNDEDDVSVLIPSFSVRVEKNLFFFKLPKPAKIVFRNNARYVFQ